MKFSFLPLFLLLPLNVSGAELSVAAQKEIPHLFSSLEASGCEFYRNGTWHDSNAASAHLKKKYQYLLSKGLLSSTESFITMAATQSSLSGTPYQVRCGTDDTVESAAWFSAELEKYRKTTTARP